MAPRLVKHSYGKARVRLSHVARRSDRHTLIDVEASIFLEGDFDAAFTEGNNRKVIPTDTMKNTVYALSRNYGISDIETFSRRLATHFLEQFKQVTQAEIELRQRPWRRLRCMGEEHPHSFIGGGSDRNVCTVRANRDGMTMTSGWDGLTVLKTTGSAFADFATDQYTTLAETEDRIFCTTVRANWTCRELDRDWVGNREKIRQVVLYVFAGHHSLSVQHTMSDMAAAALNACADIDEISFKMPNQHHLLVDLQPFDMENPNEVFMPIEQPHGLIEGTFCR